MTEGEPLEVGDVVQLDPLLKPEHAFAGCFMLVTEVKSWGAIGFVAMPVERGKTPNQAYYRASWLSMERVGKARWVSE